MTKPSKKHVGLYFGSFNPVHIGHTQLAEYVVEQKLVNEVWFVVSPCNPFKNPSEQLDEYIRLDMLMLAIGGKSKLKASDVEFGLPIPSYTVDTLKVLTTENPDYEFSLIMGSDNALDIEQWKNYTEILENYSLLVYPRQGSDASAVIGKFTRMQLLPSPLYNISSTEIRNLILQRKDASQWLHPEVWEFVIENEIYR
jgi:nicotinate-nucleotide adenylyltransferase